MSTPITESTLRQGAEAMGLRLPGAAYAGLIDYAALLLKWNRVYNLTSIRDPQQVLTHHLLDSLALLPHLEEVTTLADVGSGGGLPGIPLAIANPALTVTSVEAVSKKASFQQQVKIELALGNFMVRNERVENVKVDQYFDAIISRAFSELLDFVALTRHLLRPGGRWIAMKGVYPQSEIDSLPDDIRVSDTRVLEVPGLDAERHLIFLEVA